VSYQTFSHRDLVSWVKNQGSSRGTIQPVYWLLISFLAIFTTLVLLGINPKQAEATRKLPLPLTGIERYEGVGALDDFGISEPLTGQEATAANAGETAEVSSTTVGEQWDTITIKPGDNLADIFSRRGIPPQQLHQILELGGAARNLTRIYPGQTLRLLTNRETGLVKLDYQIDKLNLLEVRRAGDGFEIATTYHAPERHITNTSGVINSSLFLAAQEAGLSDNLTMELASIFGWDIDFALDIRKGDKFIVLYDELYLDGEKVGEGDILAATFINQGRVFQAVRYTDKSGVTEYYSPDGRNMRKAFLRTPVEYTRISSGFSLGRMHPILNRIRAHKGVDYAAPLGTPVKVTGNGKIVFRGKKGGYGNVIIVQHGNKYSTLYGHLSRFKDGLGIGSRVRQGQVIGYVGMTGLATGPHLHYEFRIDGVHHDPLTVKLPGAEPLNSASLVDFKQKASSLIGMLDALQSVQIASRE
jgi:murein DD-endopeptidase MepM/ murein hydrolase activator NlpD